MMSSGAAPLTVNNGTTTRTLGAAAMVILLLSGHIYWITVSDCVHANNASLALESKLAPNLTVSCAWLLFGLTVTLWDFLLQIVHFREITSLLNLFKRDIVDLDLTWCFRWNILRMFVGQFHVFIWWEACRKTHRNEDSCWMVQHPLKTNDCRYQWELEGSQKLSETKEIKDCQN